MSAFALIPKRKTRKSKLQSGLDYNFQGAWHPCFYCDSMTYLWRMPICRCLPTSILLRLITGAALPDDGEIWRRDALRIAHLEQEVPPDTDQTVFEVVAAGLGELGTLLTEYHRLTQHALAAEPSFLERMARLHARIDMLDGWNINQKVETVLSRLGL